MPFDDTSHGDGGDDDGRAHRDLGSFVDMIVNGVHASCELSDVCVPCVMRKAGILMLSKWAALAATAHARKHGYKGSDQTGKIIADIVYEFMKDISKDATTYFVQEMSSEILQHRKEHGVD